MGWIVPVSGLHVHSRKKREGSPSSFAAQFAGRKIEADGFRSPALCWERQILDVNWRLRSLSATGLGPGGLARRDLPKRLMNHGIGPNHLGSLHCHCRLFRNGVSSFSVAVVARKVGHRGPSDSARHCAVADSRVFNISDTP